MSEREKKNFKFGAAEGRVVIVHRCAENSMTRRPSLPSFSYIQSGTSTLLTGDAVTNASGVKGLNQVKSHWFKRCKLSSELPFKYYSYLKIDPCWSSRLILQKWVLDFFFFTVVKNCRKFSFFTVVMCVDISSLATYFFTLWNYVSSTFPFHRSAEWGETVAWQDSFAPEFLLEFTQLGSLFFLPFLFCNPFFFSLSTHE